MNEIYTREEIKSIFNLSEKINNEITSKEITSYAKNKILIQAFFEPSTRTSLSFECAMKRLGGEVITFNPNTSSKSKGESDMDTLKTLSNYGDAIVLRHPNNEFYYESKYEIKKPIINGGNGNEFHPTQALLDLYTTYKKFNNDFQFKKYLFLGDIKNSRTIHSFINLLNLYPNTKIYFFPYKHCEPCEDYIINIQNIHGMINEKIVLQKNDIDYSEYDIIYITRYQKERNSSKESQKVLSSQSRYFQSFKKGNADKMNENAIILHPLPRNNELDTRIDEKKQAYYFNSLEYSIELRMALLYKIFEKSNSKRNIKKYLNYNLITYGIIIITSMIAILKK